MIFGRIFSRPNSLYRIWLQVSLLYPYTKIVYNFLAGNECCERLAYYGMSTNLVNYLEDRLNQGNVAASNNVTNWSGTCYITPLIGAFLADSYLGRYWTIASFVVIYIIVSLL
jgi:dipeptide/tripeptide permease